MENNIKYLIETLYKYYHLNESFESITIKEFLNKIKKLLSNELQYHIIGIWWGGYYNYRWLHSIEDFKNISSDLGLANFKDEYLWEGQKKYQNETGIYTQDEIIKNLNIKNTLSYNNIKDGSLSAYCSKIPTAFLGVIEVNHDGKDIIKNIKFGLFINPKKGLDFIKYIKQHFEKKDLRKNNKIDKQNNFSLENAIKTNKEIQTYFKISSNEQKELLKKIINEIQIKNFKNINLKVFTKTEAINQLKLFRYDIMKLLCQPKVQELNEHYWFKRLNDNAKKYILNVYNLLHKDLKKLTDDDKRNIKKQMDIDWKNIITNLK